MDVAEAESTLLEPRSLRTLAKRALAPAPDYRLMRKLLLGLLGLVYLFAFIGLIRQGDALLGSEGLTPIEHYIDLIQSMGRSFWEAPSLFWMSSSDSMLHACAWLGAALSLVVLCGYGNAPILFALWLLYGSFVHVGQTWFSFGWEIQLLETGLLAVFFAPALDGRLAHSKGPPRVTVFLYRWLVFRIMLGAGLIKLRGDACWTDLTCLDFHFETQPIPNPLSPWFHHLPHGLLASGVLFNHVVECVCPWFAFGPRPARLAAGVLMLAFQCVLILSGNLAFLNWLTIVPIVACFDDRALLALTPRRVRSWLERRLGAGEAPVAAPARLGVQGLAAGVFTCVVAFLSMNVIANLASTEQEMNRSYDPLAIVNTYGAFGSVGRERDELIIEGTSDRELKPDSRWQAYELPCKPGALARRPCVLGPYHLRFDWLIWFAAMTDNAEDVPWMIHVVWKLLHGDRSIEPLLAHDPFSTRPPAHVRIRRFRYRFAPKGSEAWWVRDQERLWLPPISREHPALRAYLEARGLILAR